MVPLEGQEYVLPWWEDSHMASDKFVLQLASLSQVMFSPPAVTTHMVWCGWF